MMVRAKEPIKVGDYVRIKYMGKRAKIGRIEQILKKDPYYHDMQMYLVDVSVKHSNADFESSRIYEEDIINYSPDVIDIVEIGDYVNGYKVSFIAEDCAKFVQCDYPVETGTTNHYKFYKESIKSILTKEDFETMEYQIWRVK